MTAPLRATQIVAISGVASDIDDVLEKFGVVDVAERGKLYNESIAQSFYPQEAFYMSPEGSQYILSELRGVFISLRRRKNREDNNTQHASLTRALSDLWAAPLR